MLRQQPSILKVLGLAAVLFLPACRSEQFPERSVTFQDGREGIKAYRDFCRLEQSGVEMVNLKTAQTEDMVSLPYYLYVIAQRFEKIGREADAVKLYFRLLLNYPLLNGDNQLGVRVENRLRWLLGDKSWVMPNADTLIRKLQTALQKRDIQALGRLMSRDFSFGQSQGEKFAVNYHEGLTLIEDNLKAARDVKMEILPPENSGEVMLKTTGWAGDYKIWYFSLHRKNRPAGWEWDLAHWGGERED